MLMHANVALLAAFGWAEFTFVFEQSSWISAPCTIPRQDLVRVDTLFAGKKQYESGLHVIRHPRILNHDIWILLVFFIVTVGGYPDLVGAASCLNLMNVWLG